MLICGRSTGRRARRAQVVQQRLAPPAAAIVAGCAGGVQHLLGPHHVERRRRELAGRRQHLGVGVLLAQLAGPRAARCAASRTAGPARPGSPRCAFCSQRDRRVLHRQQVPQRQRSPCLQQRLAHVVRAVQRGHDQPVAQVEVRLSSRWRRSCPSTACATPPSRAASPSGSRCSSARSEYSASSHLMNSGSGRPVRSHDLAREQAHPPAVVGGVDARVQLGRSRAASRAPKSWSVTAPGAARQKQVAEVDDLAHAVQAGRGPAGSACGCRR